MSDKKYEPLLNDGHDEIDNRRRSVDYGVLLPRNKRKRDRTVRILVGLNVVLATLLLLLVVVWWKQTAQVPAAPYSPVWEAVRYVNQRFKKEDIFYTDDETSKELDKVWLNLTGPSNGHIILDEAEARKNVPTVEVYYEPGYYLYGLNMFHQMHCLDVIRKSFFPKHYFPNKTETEVRKHKQHCFDFLRQSIMCSGDVTLDHWFNYTWTEPSFAAGGGGKEGDDWMSMYTPEFKTLTGLQKNARAPLLWDTTHQCRDYDALWTWVKERQLVNDAYVKEFGRDDDFF